MTFGISKLFERLFGIYPSEGKRVFLFALIGYLWMLAAGCGLKFADALFLIHVGAESLSTAYVLTACGMILFSTLLWKAFQRLTPPKVVQSLLFFQLAFYLLLSLLIPHTLDNAPTALWYLLRVVGYLFYVVVLTNFWLYIDQYHHLRDAKRLYCLYASALYLGVATTGLLMQLSFFDLHHLLLVVVVLLLSVWGLIYFSSHHFSVIYDESDTDEVEEGVQSGTFAQFFLSLFRSSYTLLIICNNFLIESFSWTTEYSYLGYFTHWLESKGASEESLVPFLGRLVLCVGLLNLIFSLLIFARLVRRYGVYALLPVSALLLIFSLSGWLYFDSILFPLIAYFVVEGTVFVIDHNSFNLLLNGVPRHLKTKTRILIEHVVEPGALLFGGLLIGWCGFDSLFITLCLAGTCLIVGMAIRQAYLPSLLRSLTSAGLQFELSSRQRLWTPKKSTKEELTTQLWEIAQTGTERARLFACEVMLSMPGGPYMSSQITAARGMGCEARTQWLHLIAKAGLITHPALRDLLDRWAAEKLPSDFHVTLYELLLRYHILSSAQARRLLDVADTRIQSIGIQAIGNQGREEREGAEENLNGLLESDVEEEICLALRLISSNEGDSKRLEKLFPYSKHPSLKIARQAMQCISMCVDKRSLWLSKALLDLLPLWKDAIFQTACLGALAQLDSLAVIPEIISHSLHFHPNVRRSAEALLVEMGLKTVPILLAAIQDASLPYRSRSLVLRALGRLAPEQLRQNLETLVNGEMKAAEFVFYQMHSVGALHLSSSEQSLLEETLNSSFHVILDYIFQILGAAGVLPNCEILFHCLRSKSPRVKSQVVETLEKTVPMPIFARIQPLIDSLPLDEKLIRCEELGICAASVEEILLYFAQSPILSNHIASAVLMQRLQMPGWREELRRQMLSKEELFHRFAYELLEQQ